ncbi:MAG: PKD domain-containing protein [ANME-2 cluster archaeon]|nr:PKD domain-containing protein [ANME-2 cluster archaeon]
MIEKNPNNIVIFLTVFLLLSFAGISAAETQVSGTISTNTTWDLAGSPYMINGYVYVYNTTMTPTLIIEPGVEVNFSQSGSLIFDYRDPFFSKLIAVGTFEQPIIFNWGGLYFKRNSEGLISFSEFYNSSKAIDTQYANVLINDTVINTNSYGLISYYSQLDISNTIIETKNTGIQVSYSDVNIRDSMLNSSQYDLTLYNSGTVNSINTVFNKSKVLISGGMILNAFWNDTITVEDDHLPVQGALVKAFDKDGYLAASGYTDSDGKITFQLQEFIQTQSGKVDFNPYYFNATKNGKTGSILSIMTGPTSDTIAFGSNLENPNDVMIIEGDWIITDSQAYSDKNILLNGSLIIRNGGILNFNNISLKMRLLEADQHKIEVEYGGKFYINDSNISCLYPELNFRYYFRNYGYLNIQNSSVSWADSIYFYDSSDDSSVINSSRIENNNYGVYIYSASPNITNNEIINNTGYGIYTWNSQSIPTIYNNLIKNNNVGIDVTYSSRPVIENNRILNNKNYGIYCGSYYNPGYPKIIGNTISGHSVGIYNSASLIENNTISDNYYGISLSYRQTNIINNTIFNHTYYGIYLSNANANIINTKISNSSQKDLSLSGTTYVKSVNSNFNKSNVYLRDTSILDVLWNDTISVSYEGQPINESIIEVYSNDNIKVAEGITDETGQVTLTIKEYTQSPSVLLNFTPHIITANKSGYTDGSIQSNITHSKSDTVILGQTVSQPSETPIVILGDWIINETIFYNNKTIIVDNGNLIIKNGGTLNLDNINLKLRFTDTVNYKIEIENGGALNLFSSNVTTCYPELGLYYSFNNYGLLNIKNSTVSKANSISFYDSSDDNSSIIDSTIKENRNYGIYLYYANPIISNNKIFDHPIGIYRFYYNKDISLTNNHLNNFNYDYYLYSNSIVKSINNTFDKNKVYFANNNGILYVFWNTTVKVIDANNNPISETNVTINDSLINNVFNSTTNLEGQISDIILQEYRQTYNNKVFYTPHTITAEYDGTSNSSIVTLDESKEITIKLNINQPLTASILSPANNSMFAQGEGILFKGIGFDPIDGMLSGSSLLWSSDLDGNMGTGSQLTYSGLSIGNHTITFTATNSQNNLASDTLNIQIINASDLIVEDIEWSKENLNVGEIINFNATISNTGAGNTLHPFYVRFLIDDVYIGQSMVDHLGSGESVLVSKDWKVIPDANKIKVIVDYYNDNSESDETNNARTEFISEVMAPDLTILNIVFAPDIIDGQEIEISAEIKNDGAVNISDNIVTRFLVDNLNIGDLLLSTGLDSGNSTLISKNWTATPGDHTISILVDPDNLIQESDENNNSKSVILPEILKPDYIVSDISWTPPTFTAGDLVTFNATVKNIGDGSTLRNSITAFFIDGSQIGTAAIQGLLKDESIEVSKSWVATSGNHTVSVKADINDQIIEFNETNNTLSKNTSQIEEQYLLSLSSNSESYAEGDTAAFTARASRKSSANVYLDNDEINFTLTILDKDSNTVYTSIMDYANQEFTENVDLTGYLKGSYTARVILEDVNGVTVDKSILFNIVENFSVSLSTDKPLYDRDEIVHITGIAQYTNGSPVISAPVVLNIKVKGYTRTYSLVTGSSGNFSYYYNPNYWEAGNFTAIANVISDKLWRNARTSFEMYGLYMTPSGIIDYTMSENSSEEISFVLRNYGESDINGLTVNVVDGDTGDGVDHQLIQTPAQTLAPGAEQSFKLKITAGNVDVSQANFSVSITTNEGSYEEAELFVHLVEAVPIAIVNPTSITAGINPDDIMTRTVNITNMGYETMNDINISEPTLDWISVTSTDPGSISPGMSKSFDIILHPTNDTAPGVYQETITISSSNHQPVNIYLTISVTSSHHGDLLFHVVNDIGENLSGASIVIQNQDVLTQVFQGTTNETGYYLFDDISTGRYNYFVQASGHGSVSDSVTVLPDIQTLVEPVPAKSILGVQLTVTPITIGDEYDIELNLTFETEVPPPLLIPSPLYISYGVNFTDPEYETDSNITISNPGLISVFNVTVDSSFLAGVNITFPTGKTFFIDEIPAKSSVTIPYHLNVTYINCDTDYKRNSIQIRGDYIYFEENSDVIHNVYLYSEIPVFIHMYNCPVSPGNPVDEIIEHFTYSYHPPCGSYSPGTPPPVIQPVETVHERVKFSISQEATLERDAFAASLELTNKLTDKNIEGVKVELDIKEIDGSDASDMFFVNLTFLNNINSIDGSGIINPSAIASADWLLVPKPGAGGIYPAGEDYTVQAFIDYTVDGVPFSVNSTEERINVMPQPLLNLTYTVPGEVKAGTPFNITLNVTNVGYGTARNLRLDSAQPVIYENLAGLLVSFELIGSGIEGGDESDSMLLEFGDIGPGESKTGYWVMTASLDGEFTEFKGSFSHSNEMGGEDTSLIKYIRYIIPGTVHNINNGNSFASIQAAINDADSGDELHVDSGNYNEGIIIDKQLILRGIDIGTGKPIIDAYSYTNGVTITADGVIFDSFVVTWAEKKSVEILSNNNIIINNNISFNRHWGIFLDSSNGNEIIDNVINNNYHGINLTSSSNNVIYNNKLMWNYFSAYDDGINHWDNGVIGNYYSETTEIDIARKGAMDSNRNGICDNPYLIPGGSSVDNYPIYIPLPNDPPIPTITYSPTDLILIDNEVTFDASESFDPYGPYDGGNIVSYEWDFGDGSTDTGPIVSHSYSLLGDYEVNLTLIDDDDGITYGKEIIPVSSILGDDIELTVSETKKRLNNIKSEAEWSAEDGDYFSRRLAADERARFIILVSGALDGIAFTKEATHYFNYLGDKEWIYAPMHHIGDVAKYNIYSSKEVLKLLDIEIPIFAAEGYNEIFFILGDVLKEYNSLQNYIMPPLGEIVEDYKIELDNNEADVLTKIDGLIEDEIRNYQTDLSKKRQANQMIVWNLERNALMLHASKDYVEESNSFDKLFFGKIVKIGLKTLATLVAGPPGGATVGVAGAVGDLVLNDYNIKQDNFMFDLAESITLNSYMESYRIFNNTNAGLNNIKHRVSPEIAEGNIIAVDNVALGDYKLWGENNYLFTHTAYSDIRIHNSGDFDTNYELIADYQSWFFGIKNNDFQVIDGVSWTPVTIRESLKIKGGIERSNTIRLYYLQDGVGERPRTTINLNLFGKTKTGTYYIDYENTIFGTTKIATSSVSKVSQEEIDNAELIDYPIRTSVMIPINKMEYALTIFVENPLKTPISFNLSQEIPNEITVINTSEGVIEGNIIKWNLKLLPEEYKLIEVKFISNGESGIEIELPKTVLNIYDPVNDKTVDFLSNSNNFTTRFPIDIRANPPANASIRESIVVPINVTNLLSDSSYNGNVLIELENFERTKVYSSTTPISLAPGETKIIDLVVSPDIDPGIYIITGTWQGIKANMSIFVSYISIDAGYVLGTTLLQNQYNNKGTEVKLDDYNTITLPDGSYTFVGIPIGTYSLTLSHLGYSDYIGEVMIGEGLNVIPEIILNQNTPPSSITYLHPTPSITHINWTWSNPPDPDFNHTEIYLDGTFQRNTSEEYFNATDLTPNTEYKISTRTVDDLRNINETWVNDTATTFNTPPVSNASGPYTAIEGQAIIFNASASYDPDPGDNIVNFEWDFNNDGATDETGIEVSWTWNDDYAGQVNLTVTDSHGESSTDTTSVTILNAPPDIEAGNNQTVNEGDTVSFTGNFTDPGTGDTHTIEWNFGDGTPGSTGTIEPTHVYVDNGTYTVTLTVTDDDSASTLDTLIVTVNNVAPVLDECADQTVQWGDTITFSRSFTDPGDDSWTAEIDWGDDSQKEGILSSKIITATHVYSIPGEYICTLTVLDDDGGVGSGNMHVTVTTRATKLEYIKDLSAQYSDYINLKAQLNDPGNNNPLPDRSINFILDTQTVTATTGPDGIATTSFKLDQPAGSYDIKAEFAGDDSYSPDNDTKAMQISKEDAEITYTGDTILPTTAGSIDLRATLEEIDTDYGDLTKINVNFNIYKSSDLSYSNPIATIPSIASIPVTSSGIGVGTATATIDNLPEDDYMIMARIVPNNFYLSISSNPTPMVVYEPTDQFTTGGGWIWDPTGSHGNFGFNVKYNKKGKVKGNSIYVYRLDGLDYIVKSNAWIGLAISDNTSDFQGKAVLQIFDPVTGELQPESSGNFQFTVEAMDNELNGGPDYYEITVLDKEGLEYHNATGSLEGGNIVIHDKKLK